MALSDLSDDELVRGLQSLCGEGNRLVAAILTYLIEVEERRLDLRAACSSLYDFCLRRLGMSDGQAFRRINAARLLKKFPTLLGRIERGEIHLSSLVLLGKHLTPKNLDELVTAAAGKTKREIQELVAAIAPRPDVPSLICELPGALAPSVVAPPRSSEPSPPARIEPLSPERHAVQLTVSSEVRAKLERARDLMRHRNPSGDLATVVEKALDLLLVQLEKERLGKTAHRKRKGSSSKGRISSEVRDAVFTRDGEQCTFVDAKENRCPERALLELDHIKPRAQGGSNEAENLRVTCRAHNIFFAEQIFGKSHMRQRMHRNSHSSTPAIPTIDPETRMLAMRGLIGLGFREREARSALDTVFDRELSGGNASLEDILRQALGILT